MQAVPSKECIILGGASDMCVNNKRVKEEGEVQRTRLSLEGTSLGITNWNRNVMFCEDYKSKVSEW